MFKKKNESEYKLERKEGKRIVKEAEEALIVINDFDGMVNGNPDKLYKFVFVLLDNFLDKGLITYEMLRDFFVEREKENSKPKKSRTPRKVAKEK